MDQSILDKFWKGECSKEEVRKILAWFNTIDAELYYNHDVDLFWHNYTKGKIPKELMEIAFDNIQSRIEAREQYSDDKKQIVGVRFNLDYSLKIAAIISLIIISFGLVYNFQYGRSTPETSTNRLVWIEKSTNKGQKLTIYLNDGSKVIMNANSNLKYAQSYQDTNRIVYLEGEAFFEVAKDSLRPFTVYSGSVSTTALGTSFNIRSYANDHEIKVALVSGKVRVDNLEPGGEKNILSVGEGIIFNKNSLRTTKHQFNPVAATGWKEGIIYFLDANNQQIFSRLEDWYGVEIIINQPLDDEIYTGEFKNLSLEEVLQGLSYVKDFSFSLENGKVYIN